MSTSLELLKFKMLFTIRILLILFLYSISFPASFGIKLDFSLAKISHRVDSRFLSFAIDSNQLSKHWKLVNFTRLANLTRNLSPAYLRIGGNIADEIIFEPEGTFEKDSDDTDEITCSNEPFCRKNNGIRPKKIFPKDLIDLGKFVQSASVDLVFDLNVLLRDKKTKEWDPRNTIKIIDFMRKNGINVAGWELGNEPDNFQNNFNWTLSAKRLANDYKKLREILRKSLNSLLIGPAITRVRTPRSRSATYLRTFLRNLDPRTVDIITFHHYFMSGETAQMSDFLNTTLMDSLSKMIKIAKKIRKRFAPTQVPLWLGETSSCWGGGSRNFSDRFIASFMWLDKLGQSAKEDVKIIVRQSLVAGWYGLVSFEGIPIPDYFVSLVHKKLIGNKVLKTLISNSSNVDKNIRLYFQCALNDPGSIAILGINVGNQERKMEFLNGKQKRRYLVEEYLLEAPNSHLLSTSILLNGKIMKLGRFGQFHLTPRKRYTEFIKIPKYSLGFWIVKNVNFDIC